METEIITGLSSFLTFKLGDEKFAINIGHVKKILELEDVTKVPNVPDYYRGVINLFGDVLPVVNARQRFGMEMVPDSEKTCIIVLMLNMGNEFFSVGIVVDQVDQVVAIYENQMKDPPAFGKRFEHEFIKSIANIDNEFIIILEGQNLFSEYDLNFKPADG